MNIYQRDIDAHGGIQAFEAEVDRFKAELEAFPATVNIPAPTSTELVEEVVRKHGGVFSVVANPEEEVHVDNTDPVIKLRGFLAANPDVVALIQGE